MGKLSVQASQEALVAVILAIASIPEEVTRSGPLQQAFWLIQKGYLQTAVLKALHINRSTFHRASKATKEGREIGKSGRPHMLTGEQEEQLEKKAKERSDQGDPIFAQDLNHIVCI